MSPLESMARNCEIRGTCVTIPQALSKEQYSDVVEILEPDAESNPLSSWQASRDLYVVHVTVFQAFLLHRYFVEHSVSHAIELDLHYHPSGS